MTRVLTFPQRGTPSHRRKKSSPVEVPTEKSSPVEVPTVARGVYDDDLRFEIVGSQGETLFKVQCVYADIGDIATYEAVVGHLYDVLDAVDPLRPRAMK